jgi:hypothetical protein
MSPSFRPAGAVFLAALLALAGPRGVGADDSAPTEPKAKAPAARAQAPLSSAESKVMVSLLNATGRLMLKYLDEKQDPEKAAAYEDIFRALGGVLSHLQRGDERGTAAAGMKAMVDLMPSMKSPKRAEVLRDVLKTLAIAMAEGMRGDVAPPGPDTKAKGGGEAHAVGDVLIGALSDCLLEELSERALGGAQLDAPAPGREGFPVKAVRPGSKAEALGLQAGDAIVQVGDVPASWRGLIRAARALRRRGELPRMTVLRAGARVELKAPTPVPRTSEPAPSAGPR